MRVGDVERMDINYFFQQFSKKERRDIGRWLNGNVKYIIDLKSQFFYFFVIVERMIFFFLSEIGVCLLFFKKIIQVANIIVFNVL